MKYIHLIPSIIGGLVFTIGCKPVCRVPLSSVESQRLASLQIDSTGNWPVMPRSHRGRIYPGATYRFGNLDLTIIDGCKDCGGVCDYLKNAFLPSWRMAFDESAKMRKDGSISNQTVEVSLKICWVKQTMPFMKVSVIPPASDTAGILLTATDVQSGQVVAVHYSAILLSEPSMPGQHAAKMFKFLENGN